MSTPVNEHSTPVNEQSADFVNETYRVYSDTLDGGYVEGYEPNSLAAPHSSLEKSITWIGMGVWLASLAFIGTFLFGAGATSAGNGTSPLDPTLMMIIGGVGFIVLAIVGWVMIRAGRAEYFEYRKRTGRKN